MHEFLGLFFSTSRVSLLKYCTFSIFNDISYFMAVIAISANDFFLNRSLKLCNNPVNQNLVFPPHNQALVPATIPPPQGTAAAVMA
jgi:hypothetical protein